MDNEVVQRVFEGGGRDYHHHQQQQQQSSTSSSILQSLPLHVSIQELREKKDGLVIVGIGGPSGSGYTSLAEKVASVIGCARVSMENYRKGADEVNGLNSRDFDALVRNLEDLLNGKDAVVLLFDFQEKNHIGSKTIKSSSTGVVVVDGTYALHSKVRSLLDIRVAVVGGVHFSLLSKDIEPDLHHAQIRINNSFVSPFREPIYKLKCKESPNGHSALIFRGIETQTDNFIEMYLRPPSASEEARINDWIKVRQAGIKYYLSLGDQRIVDKNYIIRPKAEFEVGRMTLGGLLALEYTIVVSYKRASTSFSNGKVSISLETIDTLGKTFLVLRGTDRRVLGEEASRMSIEGPWITKSYLEMCLESRGMPRLKTPPPLSSISLAQVQEKALQAPKPIRVTSNISQMEPVLATWRFTSSVTGHTDS
ncbi:hypothetical protein MKX01_008877 [Papaver californicum]|nr:hypothetical protein MKX01_008877 [Papaver californicum]